MRVIIGIALNVIVLLAKEFMSSICIMTKEKRNIVTIAVKNWIGVILIDKRRNSEDYPNHG